MSVRIIDLISHTTYVVCVNFLYISGATYGLNWTPNDRFFEKLFMAILFPFRVFARNLLSGNVEEILLLYFVLMSGLGLEPIILFLNTFEL